MGEALSKLHLLSGVTVTTDIWVWKKKNKNKTPAGMSMHSKWKLKVCISVCFQVPVAGFKCDWCWFHPAEWRGREGGGKDGRIERRTRKTKMYIRDRSDEEQDEEFKSD